MDIQARNVDEAVNLALEQLGRTRDQVKVEVLATDPGGDEVLVRVTAPDTPRADQYEEDSPKSRQEQQGDEQPRGERPSGGYERGRERIERGNRADSPDRTDRPERRSGPGAGGMGGRYGRQGDMRGPRPQQQEYLDVPGEIELDPSLQATAEPDETVGRLEAVAPQAAEILQTILLGMKVRGRIVRRMPSEEGDAAFTDDEDSVVLNVVDLNERDQSAVIGRRGETLDSIQFLVNLVLGRQTDMWARIIVDVEGYRLRRKHALINLARRTAEQVQQRGQAVPLESMPPHERRIVHMSLADHPEVVTESSGVEPDRRVVVLPK